MLDRARFVLSDYIMGPEFDNNFDSYEDLDYDFGMGISSDPETIEPDEDFWIDY